MQFICTIKKVANLNLWCQNAKWQNPLADSTVTEPKFVRIPVFSGLHTPRAHEQGQVCIYGFMGKICLGKKVLRFLNPTSNAKKTENNCFCVPMRGARLTTKSKKNRPGPDGRDASRWYGRLRVQKLTLSVFNDVKLPE